MAVDCHLKLSMELPRNAGLYKQKINLFFFCLWDFCGIQKSNLSGVCDVSKIQLKAIFVEFVIFKKSDESNLCGVCDIQKKQSLWSL
jgi:hypothetical protein